jgi:hypothetical protein
MSKSWYQSFAGMALLALALAAWSSANASIAGNEPSETGNRDHAGGPAPANGAYASEVPEPEIVENTAVTLAADNDQDTIPVAQELDFVRGNSFHKPYDESLKTVARVDYYGTRYVDCEQYSIEFHTARPSRLSLLTKTGNSLTFEGSKSTQGIKIRGTPQGLGVDEERALLATFDFDTPIVALEKNQHALKPLGMQKLPGTLTWKLQADSPDGYHRILYVDSHYGDIVKFSIMNTQGRRVLDVALHDYRAVEGIRVPFAIDYRRADGTLLASDRYERISVTRTRS